MVHAVLCLLFLAIAGTLSHQGLHQLLDRLHGLPIRYEELITSVVNILHVLRVQKSDSTRPTQKTDCQLGRKVQ